MPESCYNNKKNEVVLSIIIEECTNVELFYLILIVLLVLIDSYLIQSYASEKKSRIVTNSMGLESIVPSFEVQTGKAVTIIGLSVLVFFIIVIVSSGVVVINPGERGVVFNIFTGISPNILGEGFHIVVPVINKVSLYDVKRQEYTMSGVKGEGSKGFEDDSMWSPTKEGLQVGLDVTCWFKANPAKLNILHQTIGHRYAETTVRPAIRSILRTVIAGYSIVDVYSEKRALIQKDVFEKLKESLAKDNIIVEEMLLRDVRFPAEFTKSIEEKQVAQQSAERMKYVLEKEQREAERKVIEAEGQSKSIKIINEALAQNSNYLEYLKVNKLVENIKVMVVPSGTNTLIDLKSLENNAK